MFSKLNPIFQKFGIHGSLNIRCASLFKQRRRRRRQRRRRRRRRRPNMPKAFCNIT